MNDDVYKGYRGPARDVLEKHGVKVWNEVEIDTTRGTFAGLILPRSETADDLHVVLKLHNGYNVGLAADTIRGFVIGGYKEAHYQIPESEFPSDPAKPDVLLLGTGGTIASRLDYRTGAVIPAFTPGELYGSVPELADYCNLKTHKICGVFSENMAGPQYIALAEGIAEAIEQDYEGVVIGHGTDTMHHTSAVLSFMVQDAPIPIVMVGSQRSSDRPSSDAALNLIHAINTAAYGELAEVMVCMFGPTSDKYGLLHRGTRVRKMHSSYRSTFRTIGDVPLAKVDREGFTYLREDVRRRREDKDVRITATFDDRVAMVYYYPCMKPDMISSLVDNGYKGIIIAGTGLGHVNRPLYEPLARARDAGVVVFMAVQTLWGYAQMYVYETGRELMDLGVIPAANMLPEVAYMKLCWVLGQTEDPAEIEKMMMTPIAGEITPREPHNGYLILQGGLPEVDEFVSNCWK